MQSWSKLSAKSNVPKFAAFFAQMHMRIVCYGIYWILDDKSQNTVTIWTRKYFVHLFIAFHQFILPDICIKTQTCYAMYGAAEKR